MSEESEFFLASSPEVIRFDCLEISHPDFTETYRIVRNAPAGISVTHDSELVTEWIFDGVDDFVTMGSAFHFERTDAFTLSARFRTSDDGAVIIHNSTATRGYTLFIDGTLAPGAIRFILSNDNSGGANSLSVRTSAQTFADGDEHHVLVTYDGSSSPSGVYFQVDGVAVPMTVVFNTLTGTTVSGADLQVGMANGGAAPFAGMIEHVAIWEMELSPTQALEVYGGGSPPDLNALATAPAPDWWVKLDENDVTGADGIVDYGPSNIDGTANFDNTIVGTAEFDYEYYPARVLPIASSDDLVQALAITLGDVGDVIAKENENVWAANGMDTRPTLTYRAYRSDNLDAPIVGSTRTLEIVSVTTTRDGASFEARAPEYNASRTGELYDLERFPMLRGFF